jgi:hypothetical protein
VDRPRSENILRSFRSGRGALRKERQVRKIVMAVAALLVLAPAAMAAENALMANAEHAAKVWLTLTDGGKYGKSWDEAASVFKAAISKAGWEQALRRTRPQLGGVKARSVKSATFTRVLPGAPAGEYVVIVFDTSFANKTPAVETVTEMHDTDGAWRVAGYYIK